MDWVNCLPEFAPCVRKWGYFCQLCCFNCFTTYTHIVRPTISFGLRINANIALVMIMISSLIDIIIMISQWIIMMVKRQFYNVSADEM